jgi:hypothetical protein
MTPDEVLMYDEIGLLMSGAKPTAVQVKIA